MVIHIYFFLLKLPEILPLPPLPSHHFQPLSSHEEQAAQRQEAARIEKLIRQAEDQMEQELKKLSALQSKLEKEFIKIAEAGVNFSIKFKQELKILGEKLQNSSEKFQREFLVQHGIDLKLPLKMLLLNNETDASCESTRVQEK